MTKTNQNIFVNQLAEFVKVGLLRFWLVTLPSDNKIIPLLKKSLSLLDEECATEQGWEQQKKRLTKQLGNKAEKSMLAKFYFDYDLSISEFFVFVLLGEIESSYLINLAIGELQLPDKNPRPSLHTLTAMVNYLFSPSERKQNFVVNTTLSPIYRDGWLETQGEGPLPLQKLKINVSAWHCLLTGSLSWDHCMTYDSSDFSLLGKENTDSANQLSALVDFSPLINQQHHKQELKSKSVLVIRGMPNSGRKDLACLIATKLKKRLILIPVELWNESKLLQKLVRYSSLIPVFQPSLAPGECLNFCSEESSAIILLGKEGSVESTQLVEYSMAYLSEEERFNIWQSRIKNKRLSKILSASTLVSGYQIDTLAKNAKKIAAKEKLNLNMAHVFSTRCFHSAEKLNLLAQPVFRQVDKKSIVLPPSVFIAVDRLVQRAYRRESLYEGMGPTLQNTENHGVRGLLVGESGTGKTLAASYIATSLNAPLYRVDLSSVMNKYIGESEKNLALLLEQAIANDVVLLFDEADALFGNRSQGKDTGERYANMLTNFLLTRIENHPGVVLLTTNSHERIDSAFNRRIDVVINFPLPGFEERLSLWKSHLGDKSTDLPVLKTIASYSDLSGGQIRNAVLAAAALDNSKSVSISNLIEGIKLEYIKLGKDLPQKIAKLA